MYFDSAMPPAVGFSQCVGVEESVESSGVQQSFKALTEAPVRWYCIASAAEWRNPACPPAGRGELEGS